MEIFYIDNFRSFFNTKIELSQVNFFVGENSTGKTSLMSLINLMNEFNFWFNFDFNTEYIKLGSFEDMISINSLSDNFSIGVYFQNEEEKDESSKVLMYLVRFHDDEGMASPYEMVIYSKGYILLIRRVEEKIRYKFTKLQTTMDLSKSRIENLNNIMETLNSRSFKFTNFNDLKEKSEIRRPFTLILEMIARKDKKLRPIFGDIPPFPYFLGGISWFAPIRAKPKTFYLGMKTTISPEGDHTPYILKTLIEKEKKLSDEKKHFIRSIERFGHDSGLFDSIQVITLGTKKISPFELDIVKNGASYKISSVGYGVSQIFPILIDILARSPESWFAIQQPEIHLHPRAQASFGELLFQLALRDKKCFIIETHSDFIIDRFRYCQSQSEKKIDSKIFFFQRNGTKNVIKEMNILDSGKYPEKQPDRFRTFFINESLKLLEV